MVQLEQLVQLDLLVSLVQTAPLELQVPQEHKVLLVILVQLAQQVLQDHKVLLALWVIVTPQLVLPALPSAQAHKHSQLKLDWPISLPNQ
jgi:hypothetical protein